MIVGCYRDVKKDFCCFAFFKIRDSHSLVCNRKQTTENRPLAQQVLRNLS